MCSPDFFFQDRYWSKCDFYVKKIKPTFFSLSKYLLKFLYVFKEIFFFNSEFHIMSMSQT